MNWSPDTVPSMAGQRVVITGATGGLGSHLAHALAAHGATLTLAVRDLDKGRALVERLSDAHSDTTIRLLKLDLADLDSVRRCSEELTQDSAEIDVLVNNAGIMVPPKRHTTDGFELQMGSNHLGHFAWTAHLWPVLRKSAARIVTVASLAHTMVRGIDFNVLTPAGSQRLYRRWNAYGQSKLANLLFAVELDRRIRAAGLSAVSVAAHPGIAGTNLTSTGPSLGGLQLPWKIADRGAQVLGQSARMGSWPLLMAATDPSLTGGEYIGPGTVRQLRGAPRRVGMSSTARSEKLASDLWHASEDATGVHFRQLL